MRFLKQIMGSKWTCRQPPQYAEEEEEAITKKRGKNNNAVNILRHQLFGLASFC
jgi:hypothetical protein